MYFRNESAILPILQSARGVQYRLFRSRSLPLQNSFGTLRQINLFQSHGLIVKFASSRKVGSNPGFEYSRKDQVQCTDEITISNLLKPFFPQIVRCAMRNSPVFASGLCCLEQRFEDFVLANNEFRNIDVSVLEFVWSGENAAHDSSQGSHVYRVEFAGAVVVQCCSALFGVKAEGIPFRTLEWLSVNVFNCV
jgi:hypothetical protein